ncbi:MULTISPECIES: uroporphyrinogen-III synthase [Pasteurellaceae]|uniref:Uroporphyrinogen-III synthase n=1 Tax=Pasteurella bettyae CCUG 2042 TaxID=1095749 RepID=I3D8Q4_9PAST|nr:MULTISPECIES: uroporphyrinogen-III synthase [Pasteurellaceae]EIJ68097.1 uroporphyrinogen-III synthase [Pasteurella bettyae CCUG 2042]SUB22587.1 uroporphyrinogen-III synthase [Pasteurella bettyae]
MAVLVTRPGEKGTQLVEMLNKSGVAALHLPFFTITAGRELNELPNKLIQLKANDYVMAVSQNAVEYATETLHNTGFHWRADLQYFAIGQQTAMHFSSLSGQAVHYPFQQENSEGLLALPEMHILKGKTVLLLRGNSGRELFPEQVQARGGQVEIIECYQRQAIIYDNLEQTSICKRSGIQTIVVSSGELLKSLIEFVPASEQNWLKSCQLIVVSARIEKMARHFGWTDVVVSPKADNHTLLQTLLTLIS